MIDFVTDFEIGNLRPDEVFALFWGLALQSVRGLLRLWFLQVLEFRVWHACTSGTGAADLNAARIPPGRVDFDFYINC